MNMHIDDAKAKVAELKERMLKTAAGRKHLAVADRILCGMSHAGAYAEIYPNVKNEATAAANCAKLLNKSNSLPAEYIRLSKWIVSAPVMEQLGVTQERLIRNLTEIMDRGLQAHPLIDNQGNPMVISDKNGQLCAAFTYDPRSATRAIELLGKELGMFTEKRESSAEDLLAQAFAMVAERGKGRSPLPSGE